MKKVIFLMILMISNASFAKFSSEQELFNAFRNIGMDTVVEITDVSSARNLLVRSTSDESSEPISQFDQAIPVEALEYSVDGLFGATNYKAFSIAEIILCYSSSDSTPSRSAMSIRHNFEKCYMLPRKIKDVVSRLNL